MKRITCYIVLCLICRLSAQAFLSNAHLENTSIAMSGPTLTLRQISSNGVVALASGKTTNANWIFGSILQLGTNQSVWTWPVDFTCVGQPATGYTATLISPNTAVVSADIGDLGGSISFIGSDGITRVARTLSSGNLPTPPTCMFPARVVTLESNLPSAVKPAMVLPRGNYTNSLGYCYGVWVHKNTGRMDLGITIGFMDPVGGGATPSPDVFFPNVNQSAQVDPTSGFGQDTRASGGDSSSPMFLIVNGNAVFLGPVSCCCQHGQLISEQSAWDSLTNLVDARTLSILPPFSFEDYVAAPPGPVIK